MEKRRGEERKGRKIKKERKAERVREIRVQTSRTTFGAKIL